MKFNGTSVLLYFDGVAIGHSTDTSLDVSMSTREETDKSSAGWKESGEGTMEWSATGDFFFNADAAQGFSEAFARLSGRGKVGVRIADVDATAAGSLNANQYTGSAWITGLPANFPLEDTATYSITLEGTGPLLESVQT